MPDYWAPREYFRELDKPRALRDWEYVQYIQGKPEALLLELIRLNPGDCALEKKELRWRRQEPDGPFRYRE